MAEISENIGSRFSGTSQFWAGCILTCAAFAILLSIWTANEIGQPAPHNAYHKDASTTDVQGDDLGLYRVINARIWAGEDYYSAAISAQRENGYPTKPFITVRLPTLAWIGAWLGPVVMRILLFVLAGFTLLIWAKRLEYAMRPIWQRVIALCALASALIPCVTPDIYLMHEFWAGLLVALSLGLYRVDNIWPAVAAAAAALAMREMALPFVLLMTALSVLERRWREAAVWTLLIALFAAAMVAHANKVNMLIDAGDLSSPGWSRFGGWPLAIRALILTGIAKLLLACSLFGWIGWHSETGLRGMLYLAGYSVLLMLFGREQNYYWAFMVAPLSLMGLAFLPQAASDLWRSVRQ